MVYIWWNRRLWCTIFFLAGRVRAHDLVDPNNDTTRLTSRTESEKWAKELTDGGQLVWPTISNAVHPGREEIVIVASSRRTNAFTTCMPKPLL